MHTANKKILIDFEKIKDPFSGLGQYCAHLKNFFDQSSEHLSYWIPSKQQKKWARIFPFLIPECDIFHAVHQDSPFNPWAKKTKTILTVHDLNALYENSSEPYKRKYKKNLQKKINRASAITFISNFTKTEVEKNFNLDGKKTKTIYNGISLSTTSKMPSLIPQKKFLFSIGTVLPKKNFHVLIDFLKELPEYNIVLAGTTFHSYAEKMKKRIEEEGLSERFFLIGTIAEEEKRWYYEHAEAFIFPSLLEGFGLPVAEAMSFGLPLFLSPKTSLPEIGGTEATYFSSFEGSVMAREFTEGMNSFTPEKKSKLIERSHLFSWKKAADQYLELYRTI